MERKRLELIAFSTLFVGLSILMFFVFQPFLRVLVLAGVLSVLLHPLYEKLVKIFYGSKSFVAGLLVIIALIFLIVPTLFFGLQILGQAQDFFYLSHIGQSQYINIIQQNVDTLVGYVVPGLSFNISDSINKVLTFVSGNLGGLLSETTYVFFQTFFLLFIFFFFARDGEKMLTSIASLSPFGKEQNKEISNSVYQTIASVVRGTIFVGLIRAVLLVAGFYFLGIPNAILWGSVGGIIGAVPGLGTLFVVIPAFLYLLLYGNIFSVIAMGLFGIFLVFFIDNMLSVYFFGNGLDVPPLFILLSILGGIILFGPLGFIFGPIILSLFISSVCMYKILILRKS